MKNIEIQLVNQFGEIYKEKFNCRRFSRLLKKECSERNITEYQAIIEFIEYYVESYYSNENIISAEFSFLDSSNYRCTISKNF